eukprot:6964476-Pyramimonas_sp.AAC.1
MRLQSTAAADSTFMIIMGADRIAFRQRPRVSSLSPPPIAFATRSTNASRGSGGDTKENSP